MFNQIYFSIKSLLLEYLISLVYFETKHLSSCKFHGFNQCRSMFRSKVDILTIDKILSHPEEA